MAVGKEIKNRIKSVKNTKKITKAMELVAASKMKRAVSKTLDARAYADYSWQILESLSEKNLMHPLFERGAGEKTLVVLITSNKGLCGAYNAQAIRSVLSILNTNKEENYEFVTIGRKGDFMLRRIGQNVIANFDVGEAVELREALPICDFLITKFTEGEYKKVLVVYTDFVSALTQTPRVKQLLPFEKESLRETIETMGNTEGERSASGEFLFEPGYENLMNIIIPKVSRMQVYHMLLESIASEQSSRMVAMKNASEAAGEMIDDLTLAFNKARQASITQEISEISAGMASVS
jgi:F-type H+-transporting ATPase subunit gamma